MIGMGAVYRKDCYIGESPVCTGVSRNGIYTVYVPTLLSSSSSHTGNASQKDAVPLPYLSPTQWTNGNTITARCAHDQVLAGKQHDPCTPR
jgi:hypothetical protein